MGHSHHLTHDRFTGVPSTITIPCTTADNCSNVYVSGGAAIHQRIETAIQESLHTCEVCGHTGERREGGRIKTLCDEHDASGQEVDDHG
jgi:hypothetical protein